MFIKNKAKVTLWDMVGAIPPPGLPGHVPGLATYIFFLINENRKKKKKKAPLNLFLFLAASPPSRMVPFGPAYFKLFIPNK
jgi:hypothetical protein